MALLALSLDVLWLVLAFGVRPVITWRRTGDAGFRRIGGRLGGAAWWGGVLFVVALVAGVSAPVAAMAGLRPLPVLQRPVVQAVGLALAVVGGLSTLAAQGGMGAAWRVGVDPS
ncbi:MAG TPA: isoprenylcysteine carboxylmethyltransferase family protein, partial [Kineosporiaceae bacterium]|nr:isoprenylcysteine carboxylmethyltransferase family protein [Kineosporiaceae bacterium]